MNQFELAGRVLELSDISETANGLKLRHVRVCLDKIKDDEKTFEIYDVALFRQLAEMPIEVGQYIAVVGRLSANNYEKDGNQYYNCSLVGNSVTLLGN